MAYELPNIYRGLSNKEFNKKLDNYKKVITAKIGKLLRLYDIYLTPEELSIVSNSKNILDKCYFLLKIQQLFSFYEDGDPNEFWKTDYLILLLCKEKGYSFNGNASFSRLNLCISKIKYYLFFLEMTPIRDCYTFAGLVKKLKEIDLVPFIKKENESNLSFIDTSYNEIIKRFQTMDYKEYLNTIHWKTFKNAALLHFNKKCTCGNTSNLQVHHKTYDNLGKETFSDVIVLCDTCHKKIHNLP